jgi:hypothetical protein
VHEYRAKRIPCGFSFLRVPARKHAKKRVLLPFLARGWSRLDLLQVFVPALCLGSHGVVRAEASARSAEGHDRCVHTAARAAGPRLTELLRNFERIVKLSPSVMRCAVESACPSPRSETGDLVERTPRERAVAAEFLRRTPIPDHQNVL